MSVNSRCRVQESMEAIEQNLAEFGCTILCCTCGIGPMKRGGDLVVSVARILLSCPTAPTLIRPLLRPVFQLGVSCSACQMCCWLKVQTASSRGQKMAWRDLSKLERPLA